MKPRAEYIRQEVANHLENVLTDPQLPQLGKVKEGKIRNSYSIPTSNGNLRVMIASDRVSAFDVILNRAIPFKGVVLNAIAEHSFAQLPENVNSAILHSPHPRFMIQKELTNIGIECIVRGYIWGGIANEYEQGKRIKCEYVLPEDMLRYAQLKEPWFTPTTKAEQGHDQDIRQHEMAHLIENRLHCPLNDWQVHGLNIAFRAESGCLALYEEGVKQAEEKGLLLIDTKYELGIDRNENLILIDEIHTPDSSRYVEQTEWQTKFPKIQAEMQTGKYSTVTALLKEQPQLKIKEWSKQVVRDVLVEQGYNGTSGNPPTLTDQQVIETSARYIEVYERLTGKEFDFNYFSQPFNEKTIVKYLKNI